MTAAKRSCTNSVPSIPAGCFVSLTNRTVPTIVPVSAKTAPPEPTAPTPRSAKLENREGLTRKIKDVREADFRLAKPPYAALWKSSIWRIQLVSGFHLGEIWATNTPKSFSINGLRH